MRMNMSVFDAFNFNFSTNKNPRLLPTCLSFLRSSWLSSKTWWCILWISFSGRSCQLHLHTLCMLCVPYTGAADNHGSSLYYRNIIIIRAFIAVLWTANTTLPSVFRCVCYCLMTHLWIILMDYAIAQAKCSKSIIHFMWRALSTQR